MAKRVITLLEEKNRYIKNKSLFYTGALLPDLSLKDKKESHFRKMSQNNILEVPNLEIFLKKYGNNLENELYLGIYAHLFLDYRYYDIYFNKNYEISTQQIKNKKNNISWDFNIFYSIDGIYGAYSQINQALIRDFDLHLEEIKINTQNIKIDELGDVYKDFYQDYAKVSKEGLIGKNETLIYQDFIEEVDTSSQEFAKICQIKDIVKKEDFKC